MADKFFNLEEAESLLPALERLLNTARENKKTIEAVDAELTAVKGRIMMMGGVLPDCQALARRKSQKDDSLSQLKEALQQITSSGCLIKDHDLGLVDFPCLVNDREIYLCWKLGESKIGFWHDVNEGFRGRKPLDKDLLELLYRRRPN